VYDVADKVKFATFMFRQRVYNEEKELVAVVYRTHLIKGIGGFGYKGTKAIAMPEIPSSAPERTFSSQTQVNQAILYRLSLDTNPLHIDP